jgi:hypothetical protein
MHTINQSFYSIQTQLYFSSPSKLPFVILKSAINHPQNSLHMNLLLGTTWLINEDIG